MLALNSAIHVEESMQVCFFAVQIVDTRPALYKMEGLGVNVLAVERLERERIFDSL